MATRPSTAIRDSENEGNEAMKVIFVQAFCHYEKALLRYSFYKVSDCDLSDDLVQTTFLKTWEFLLKFGEIRNMNAFLYHVLNNLIIDEYRKHSSVSLDVLTENGFEISVDESQRLLDTIDGKSAVRMIPLLKEKYADVLTRHFVEEMPLSDIAQATKQPNNTVVVQIRRGLDKLALLFRGFPTTVGV